MFYLVFPFVALLEYLDFDFTNLPRLNDKDYFNVLAEIACNHIGSNLVPFYRHFINLECHADTFEELERLTF